MTAALAHAVGPALRRRADAAHRLEPLEGRRGADPGARDPALTWPPAPRTPSTFGLSDNELRSHAKDLVASGWSTQEIQQVLSRPEPVAA